jgi:hypothetical protein
MFKWFAGKDLDDFNIDNVKKIRQDNINDQIHKELLLVKKQMEDASVKGFMELKYTVSNMAVKDIVKKDLTDRGFNISNDLWKSNILYVSWKKSPKEIFVNYLQNSV